jgi:hypothetical protein
MTMPYNTNSPPILTRETLIASAVKWLSKGKKELGSSLQDEFLYLFIGGFCKQDTKDLEDRNLEVLPYSPRVRNRSDLALPQRLK